jgi:hypothetical protein
MYILNFVFYVLIMAVNKGSVLWKLNVSLKSKHTPSQLYKPVS